MGYRLTTYDGNPLPRPAECENYRQSEIIVSASESMQQKLIEIMQSVDRA